MTTLLHAADMATGHQLTHNDPRQVLVLRAARTPEERAEIMGMVLYKREQYRTWVTLQQRKWQTKVSRRPQRGNHHDSHRIREGYVRC